MKKMPQGNDLNMLAEELGVSRDELGYEDGTKSEPILQHRVIEALRARREQRLWIVALISAIASVISAIAAWLAISINVFIK